MPTNHGINVTEVDTSLSTPVVAESGVPFVVGIAPIQSAENPAPVGVPVRCNSWSEAVAKFGFYPSADWSTYTLCEAMFTQFQLYGAGPVIFVNLLDPSTMKSAFTAAAFAVTNHRATLPGSAIINSGLSVKNGETALTKGTDYEAFYSEGKLIIELLSTGTAYSASSLNIGYDAIATTSINAAAVAAAFEQVELCLTTLGVVPDVLLAPGFSQNATVAAVMAAKASGINGMFKAIALVDIDSASGGATSYSAAITKKGTDGLTDDFQVACWPMAKLDGALYHMSCQIAGAMCALDADNDGIPYESPSNKALQIDSLCLADGTTEVLLTKAQADALNAQGIMTAINFINGWVAWGNYMACYPTNTDVKDYFIPNRRMFNWIGNTEVKTFWSQIDAPMTRIRVDSIVNSTEIWLSGLVGSQYLLGARVEFLEDENSDANLAAGKVKLHNYFAPPGPMQELDFVLEYDASYVSEAFAS